MTCRPKDLAQKNRNRIAVHCGREKSGGSLLPGKNVCKVLCGTCPGGCGEIDTAEFINNTKNRRVTCVLLSKTDPLKRYGMCIESSASEDTASDVCLVTCNCCTKQVESKTSFPAKSEPTPSLNPSTLKSSIPSSLG